MCAPPCVPLPSLRLRQQHLGKFGLRGLALHTSIERTTSANVAKERAVDSSTIVEGGSLDDAAAGSASQRGRSWRGSLHRVAGRASDCLQLLALE